MKRAAQLSGDERSRIAGAVREAESRTAAEIVPVLATSSGRYDRAEDIAGVIVGLGAMILAWLLFQREEPRAGGWDGLPLALPLWLLVALVIVGFIVGSALAARVWWLRRLLVPPALLIEETLAQASRLFHDQRIHHTEAQGGVLVYLSLFERQAVILADQTAFAAIGQAVLDEQCRMLRDDLRRGDVAMAMCAAIARLGELLAPKLPRGSADRNELGDALVTID